MINKDWTAKDFIKIRNTSLKTRIDSIGKMISSDTNVDHAVYSRILSGQDGKNITLYYPEAGKHIRLIMFGSNNYLGLSSDIRVKEAASKATNLYGAGICGSAVLNGYTLIQKELEELTADFKRAEDAVVFSSGFFSNLAWTRSLTCPRDTVIYDAESHMSFREGIKGSNLNLRRFAHNSTVDLQKSLQDATGDVYVFIEGLYSMKGDKAPIQKIHELTFKSNALLVIDDAHGTGTLGESGRGVVQGLRSMDQILSIGTYSKALGSNGGFLAGNKDLISYLRAIAPNYIFSAALSPANIGGAIQSLKILEKEVWRVSKLRENSLTASECFKNFNNISERDSPIIFLQFGEKYDIKKLTLDIQRLGFFVNPITFPAVSKNESGLRISLSSLHEKSDIIALSDAINEAVYIQDIK